MAITISGFNKAKRNVIEEAATKQWGFEDWSEYGKQLSASGDSNLCGGETEVEFAERLSLAVWKANGKFCKVEVNATYLEELPYETYELDKDDYKRLVNAAKTPQPAA
jgi:hypothetical protein